MSSACQSRLETIESLDRKMFDDGEQNLGRYFVTK